MAQIEKTDQIDKYLDQIDKKQDSSFKKKLFLLFGFLFITVTCIFAYNQFAGKETLANNNTNSANGSNSSDLAASVYVNDDSQLTDNELIAELEAEEAAAALLEEEDAVEDDDDGDEEEKSKVKDNNSNKEQEGNSPSNRPGISQRSFTADQLPGSARLPKKFNQGNSKDASSEENSSGSDNNEAEKEEEADTADVVAEKSEEEIVEKPTPEKEEVVEATPEPEPVVKESPKGISKDPSYPGGESNMRKFFSRRITYPSQAIDNKIEGNVNVRIKVNEKGKIVDSQVVKGIGSGCDREVLRAINRMPKWEPAMENGKVVSKHYLLSVAFKLPK